MARTSAKYSSMPGMRSPPQHSLGIAPILIPTISSMVRRGAPRGRMKSLEYSPLSKFRTVSPKRCKSSLRDWKCPVSSLTDRGIRFAIYSSRGLRPGSAETLRASPKSINLIGNSYSVVKRKFPPCTSPCTYPAWCTACRAINPCRAIFTSVEGSTRDSSSATGFPRTSSMQYETLANPPPGTLTSTGAFVAYKTLTM